MYGSEGRVMLLSVPRGRKEEGCREKITYALSLLKRVSERRMELLLIFHHPELT